MHEQFIKYSPALIEHLKSARKSVFVPSVAGMEKRNEYEHDGYALSWWEDTSFYRYDQMLTSAYYGRKWPNFREQLRLPEDLTLIGDSGGFQALTKKVKLDPVEILRWQEANCNVAFTLDDVPVNMIRDEMSGISSSIWAFESESSLKKALESTAKNARAAHDAWRNHDMELLFVSHGWKQEYMEWSINALKKEGLSMEDFDGQCKSVKGANPFIFAQQLYHALTTLPKNSRFHFLGMGGWKTTTLLYYAMTYRPDLKVTFDSSSYGFEGATKKHYWVGERGYSLGFGNLYTCGIKSLPCLCPVCSIVKDPEYLRASGSVSGGLITLHNLWLFLNYTHKLACLSTDRNDFYEWAKRFVSDKLVKVMEFLDYAMDQGIDRAMMKFSRMIGQIRQKSEKRTFSLKNLAAKRK